MRPRLLVGGLAASLLASLLTATPAFAETSTANTALGYIRVANPVLTGYDRDLFEHWVDDDGDGCDTRREVLIEESLTPVSVGSGCSISGGSWYSYLDGATWNDPADVDIDHTVALAEAWASGANSWTPLERRQFANDLGYAGSLAAVTDNENQSKSDRDPASYLPSLASARCEYVSQWVAVKYRWDLAVDDVERSAIVDVLNQDGCGDQPLELPYRMVTADPIRFQDIGGAQFEEQILWLAGRGVTRGWQEADGSYTYRPMESVKRDAMAAFLYRLAGSPSFTPPARSPFVDVPTSNQFYLEISWLAAQGITTGWDAGNGQREYRPLQPVARDAMAAFLYRWKGSPAYDAPSYSYFSDVQDGVQFYREMSWMASQGISNGWQESYGGRTYRPLEQISREGMAAFMYRLINGGSPLPYPTSPPPQPPVEQPPVTQPPVQPPANVYYRNCSEVRAAGKAPLYRGQPGYGSHLDRDNDGIACE